MRDSEIVASIVAGEPEGLAAAYDKYAGDLYGYCQSLLRVPDDAADAVQDTFLVAASKLGGLRNPERLRAWLYAVARNECLGRLKSRNASSPLQDIPEPPDDSVDVGGEAERAETVALVRAAVGGLNDGERDVINQLWHGLEVAEAAAVLGVSRNYAYTLFSRARDQLEASVGVLLVGRSGREDCATLDSLLGDWDGRLTALLRKRVGRHIDRCPVCSDRRRRELTPALLYGVSPGAILGLAALRGTLLAGARPFAGPLSGMRDALLRQAADPGTAPRAAGGHGARAFRPTGFPRPARYGHPGALRQHLPLAAGGTAAAATAAVLIVAVPHLRQGPGTGGSLTASAPLPAATGTVSGAAARPGGGQAPGSAPGSAPGTAAGAPAASRGPGAAAAGKRTGSGLAASSAAAKPAGTARGQAVTATPGATVSARPASAAGGLATGPASVPGTVPGTVPASGPATGPATVTATAPARATAPASSPPPAGTLSVSPTTVLVSPLLGGSLRLTASGGPVSWSLSEPASLAGRLTVSPASGTLAAGGSVTVAITVSGLASLDTQLTVSPGGQLVTVVLGLG